MDKKTETDEISVIENYSNPAADWIQTHRSSILLVVLIGIGIAIFSFLYLHISSKRAGKVLGKTPWEDKVLTGVIVLLWGAMSYFAYWFVNDVFHASRDGMLWILMICYQLSLAGMFSIVLLARLTHTNLVSILGMIIVFSTLAMVAITLAVNSTLDACEVLQETEVGETDPVWLRTLVGLWFIGSAVAVLLGKYLMDKERLHSAPSRIGGYVLSGGIIAIVGLLAYVMKRCKGVKGDLERQPAWIQLLITLYLVLGFSTMVFQHHLSSLIFTFAGFGFADQCSAENDTKKTMLGFVFMINAVWAMFSALFGHATTTKTPSPYKHAGADQTRGTSFFGDVITSFT